MVSVALDLGCLFQPLEHVDALLADALNGAPLAVALGVAGHAGRYSYHGGSRSATRAEVGTLWRVGHRPDG